MKNTPISSFANSLVKDYIPKEGPSFSLFRIEILAGLTVALALVPEANELQQIEILIRQ